MYVAIDFSALRRVKFHEYALRFLLGGSITVVTGIIAHKFGAAMGGLFLAFPAIFPASCTLIEKHEVEKKSKLGLDGRVRGRKAAALDAVGAALGSIGLVGFAAVAWQWLERHESTLILGLATLHGLG